MPDLPQLSPGFYPFWFWNARICPEEIEWQIEQMAQQGIRGFFLHPRQGLEQPYLSSSFFEMAGTAIRAAKHRNMLVCLYDEYPYPSGIAGGAVTQNDPALLAASLWQKRFTIEAGEHTVVLPQGKVLSALLYPVRNGKTDWMQGKSVLESMGMHFVSESYNETGLTAYTHKRYFASEPHPVLQLVCPHEAGVLYVSVQTRVASHKYWGDFTDVLRPEAVRAFISLTHEKYARHFGPEMGGCIAAVFTDETTAGWSAILPDAYEQEYGCSMLPLLPALHDAEHPDHLLIRQRLDRLRLLLFCRSYEEPLQNWCHAHNLLYTGEKPSLRLSQLRYMDVPGCDTAHTRAGVMPDLLGAEIRSNARAAASAAFFYGRQNALCEAFHSMGWGATLQDVKLLSEALMLLGVQILTPHGFFYSTHGLRKHDAPPSFFFQMPSWPLFHHLTEHMERIAAACMHTLPVNPVLLYEPSSGLPSRQQKETYRQVMYWLMEHHIEFLLVDTDVLQSAEISEGRICTRGISADVLIVPPMQRLEDELQQWLQRFTELGGSAVYPNAENLEETLAQLLTHAAAVKALEGDAAKVWLSHRASDGRELYFLLNTGSSAVHLQLNVQQHLAESASPSALRAVPHPQGGWQYTRLLQPLESALLASAPAPPAVQNAAVLQIELGGDMEIEPEQPNLLRFSNWEMSLLDEQGVQLQTAQVTPAPLANQLGQGAFRFAPRTEVRFGLQPLLHYPEMQVRYSARFEACHACPVMLLMEPDSIAGDWNIQINGEPPLHASDFLPVHHPVRGTLGADITSLLVQGQNEICVHVHAANGEQGLRNTLYLSGRFAVHAPSAALLPPVSNGKWADWEGCGLPYYAGTLVCTTEFTLQEAPAKETTRLEFTLAKLPEGPMEVQINGQEWRPLLWTPYTLLLPSSALKAGKNSLAVRVYSGLLRAFEGEWFCTETHATRPIVP